MKSPALVFVWLKFSNFKPPELSSFTFRFQTNPSLILQFIRHTVDKIQSQADHLI